MRKGLEKAKALKHSFNLWIGDHSLIYVVAVVVVVGVAVGVLVVVVVLGKVKVLRDICGCVCRCRLCNSPSCYIDESRGTFTVGVILFAQVQRTDTLIGLNFTNAGVLSPALAWGVPQRYFQGITGQY